MSHKAVKSKRQQPKNWLKTTATAQFILRLWDKCERLWTLKVIPFVNKLVLPGCAGVPLMEILRHFSNRELWQSARALSYSFLLALPPLLIFFFTLIPLFPIEGIQNELLIQLKLYLPSSIYPKVSNIITEVMSHKHTTLLSVGFAVSVILAANGMHSMVQSFNSVNHTIENRPVIRRYGMCLLMVLVLYVLVVLILSLFIGYKYMMFYLLKHGFIAESKMTFIVFNFGRWVLLTFLTLLILSLLYYFVPVKKQRLGFFSIGSVVATGCFFILSWGLQIYINNINQSNLLYGSIGSLLVVMLWIYWNCVVILAGYAINIAIATARNDIQPDIALKKKRRSTRVGKEKPRYQLSTNNPAGRQPAGSELYHSPSGVAKYRNR